MPEILRHVGPQQYEFLKDLIGQQAKGAKPEQEGEEDDDDVPPLVEGTFDSAGAKEEPKEEPKEEKEAAKAEPAKEAPKEEPKAEEKPTSGA